MKKKLTMFITGFTVMLIAGAATAQVGLWEIPTIDGFASDRPATAIANGAQLDPGSEQVALLAAAAQKEAAEKEAARLAELAAAEKEAAEKDAAEKEAAEKAAAELASTEEPSEEADTTPPEIDILHPTDGQVFEKSTIAFEGTTEPGARVFAGKYEADVDADGNWRIVLILSPGKNKTTFVAKDAAGNQASASVTAVYDAPEKDVAFTAHQKYGETAHGYEKFWGTAAPGTKVTVTSDYGSASTKASESGEWWLKLHFEAAAGTTFKATVRDSEGHSKAFEVHVVEKVHEFSAKQKYGSCSENPPYDVFYGTGTPGMVVEIISKYGYTTTAVGDGGTWDKKVYFEDAVVGEVFEIVIETSEGHRKVFEFKRLEG